MNLIDLKSDIVGNNMKKFYVIVGEEIGVINIYLNQISKANSLHILRKESVSEVWSEIKARGMFASEPHLYIVRGDKDFQKEEKNWDKVVSELKDSMLILLYDKIDSRLKFGKHFSDVTVTVEALDKPVIVKYIMKEVAGLSQKSAEELVDICGNKYDICMLEADKIKTYQNISKLKADNCLQKLVDDGSIYYSAETDVFQFVDIVCRREPLKAYKILEQLKRNDISSITILGTLYTSLKAIMLIQSCGSNNIAEVTGLDNGAIWYNKKRTGYYSISELVHAITLIADTVLDIKSGKIENDVATEYVLCCMI